MKENTPKDTYDAMAQAYAEKTATSVWNAKYDRPNVIDLIPKSGITDVLEVGCGSGALTEWLVSEKFTVSAFDISPKLVQIVIDRIGTGAIFFVADASQNLPQIPDHSIDLVVSSLVFHYVEDWEALFSEFARILRPTGTIVFSTHHPHADWLWAGKENYFEKDLYEETWSLAGQSHRVQYYHRTLMEMFSVFKQAGFYVDELREPFPLPEVEEIDPEAYHTLTTKPRFLYLRLKRLQE